MGVEGIAGVTENPKGSSYADQLVSYHLPRLPLTTIKTRLLCLPYDGSASAQAIKAKTKTGGTREREEAEGRR